MRAQVRSRLAAGRHRLAERSARRLLESESAAGDLILLAETLVAVPLGDVGVPITLMVSPSRSLSFASTATVT